MRRGVAAFVLLLSGAAVAVCAVAVHGRWWGLVLAVAASVATLWALPRTWWGRLPYAVGWSVAVMVLAGGGSGGDVLVAGNAAGYVMLATGFGLLVAGVLSLRPRPMSHRAMVEDSDSRPAPS